MKKVFYKELSNKFSELFKKKILAAKSIVITSHLSPDDDSISAVLSLYYYLIRYLEISEDKVSIFYTGEKNSRWKMFKYFEKVNFVTDIADYIDIADLLILLDGSFWNRFSRKEDVSKYDGYTICLDHHPVKQAEFNLHLDFPGATSTAEIIYRLFYEKEKLDKTACELLLFGILGDTGNFKYIDPPKSGVLSIGQCLIEGGNINVESYVGSYNRLGVKTFNCLRKLMENSRVEKVRNWPDCIVSYIDTDFINKEGLSDTQTSDASLAFTAYLKGIGEIDWGFVVTPRLHDNTNTVSFRSFPGSVNVREMCEKMKIGGGHDRAAGGKLQVREAEGAVEIILSWMRANKPTFS